MGKLGENKWAVIQLVYMGIFSVVYYLFSLNIVGILNILEFKFDTSIFIKIVFLLLPVYVVCVWRVKDRITGFDFGMQFTPFFLWVGITSIFGGKSATNFYFVELHAAIIISGLYLMKYITGLKESAGINWVILIVQYILRQIQVFNATL
jgi:hypothetical protein